MLVTRNVKSAFVLTVVVLLAPGTHPVQAREEIFKITPNDIPVGSFGWSLAISGDYIVVGSPGDFAEAYVFKREGAGWIQQQKLAACGWRFGDSVAIDGDLLVVGAPTDPFKSTDPGAACVYRLEGETWVFEAPLISSGSSSSDGFGASVSIDGDRIVVGAPGSGFKHFDRAYVFRREGTTWVEEAELVGLDTQLGDRFGSAVSISGDVLVVGAREHDDPVERSGAAYLFRREDMTWAQEAKLTASNAGVQDFFGASLWIGGESVVVGAHNNDEGGTNSGAVYIFHRKDIEWVEQANPTASDAEPLDDFGFSVALQDNAIVVGATGGDDESPEDPFCNSGSAYLFMTYGSTWDQMDKLLPSDATCGRSFGRSVSIGGEYAFVTGGGSVYVFSLPEEIPTVSQWGVIAMGLLMVAGGMLVIGRRRARHSPGDGDDHIRRCQAHFASVSLPETFHTPYSLERRVDMSRCKIGLMVFAVGIVSGVFCGAARGQEGEYFEGCGLLELKDDFCIILNPDGPGYPNGLGRLGFEAWGAFEIGDRIRATGPIVGCVSICEIDGCLSADSVIGPCTPIPAASNWGVLALALLLLTVATIALRTRRSGPCGVYLASLLLVVTFGTVALGQQAPLAPHHPEHLLVRFKPSARVVRCHAAALLHYRRWLVKVRGQAVRPPMGAACLTIRAC